MATELAPEPTTAPAATKEEQPYVDTSPRRRTGPKLLALLVVWVVLWALFRGHDTLAVPFDQLNWFGRWGNNYVYGVGAVVPALVAAGVATDSEPIERACTWLLDHQNADGGWGEDLRSYRDPAWAGRGASTPSQTAWALLALLAGGGYDTAVERGIGWLADAQRADGGWDEDLYTGTGFPGDFYLSYEMYRLVFPISALGRFLGTDGRR